MVKEGDDRPETDTSAHLDRLIAELAEAERRIAPFQARGLYIIQFIILVFGGAVIAASEVREALVALPVFWSMWTLFAQQSDRDTQKLKVHASQLEIAANAELRRLSQPQVFQYRTQIAPFQPPVDNLTYLVPALYFVVMQTGAWVAGYWVLWIGDWSWGVWPLSALFVLSTAALVRGEIFRKKSEENVRTEIAAIAGAFHRSLPVDDSASS